MAGPRFAPGQDRSPLRQPGSPPSRRRQRCCPVPHPLPRGSRGPGLQLSVVSRRVTRTLQREPFCCRKPLGRRGRAEQFLHAQRGRFNLWRLQWGQGRACLRSGPGAAWPCSPQDNQYVPVCNWRGRDEGISSCSARAAGSRCQAAAWRKQLRAAQPQATQPPRTGLF